MSERWVPMRYRDFYDHPRAFVVEWQGDLWFFDCPFNDARDDYGNQFTVFKLSDEGKQRVEEASWANLADYADRVGVVPTEAVKFDETRRQAVDSEIFALLNRKSG